MTPSKKSALSKFQHTAARRRLRSFTNRDTGEVKVSTHSRAEAAARAGT